jgi:hypothetical protein
MVIWAWIGWTSGAIGHNPCWLSNRDATTRWSAHIGAGSGQTDRLGLYDGASYATITAPAQIPANSWHQIAYTLSRETGGTTPTLTGYVDGVKVGTMTKGTGSVAGLPINVGSARPAATDVWRGYLAWPLITHDCYTDDEIRWLYEEPYAFVAPAVLRRRLWTLSPAPPPPPSGRKDTTFYGLRPFLGGLGGPSYG